MDIKKKVDEIVAKLKGDPKQLEKFAKDPVAVVEGLLGIDLPDEQIKNVVDMVKAKINLDKASDLLGGLGSFLKK